MERKRKELAFKENNSKTYSLILQHYNPKLYGKIKGVGSYENIKTNKYGIEIEDIIYSMCHFQYEYKNDVMSATEMNKRVYLLYQETWQSNN